MLVYCEVMVWSIIDNGVVYLKFKIVYEKTTSFKLSPVSAKFFCYSAIMHMYGAADGGIAVCNCV